MDEYDDCTARLYVLPSRVITSTLVFPLCLMYDVWGDVYILGRLVLVEFVRSSFGYS